MKETSLNAARITIPCWLGEMLAALTAIPDVDKASARPVLLGTVALLGTVVLGVALIGIVLPGTVALNFSCWMRSNASLFKRPPAGALIPALTLSALTDSGTD